MLANMRYLIIIMSLALAICLNGIANADNGTASYYTHPYIPSACFGNKEHGANVAAASKELWNNRKACGQQYRVKCIGYDRTINAPQPCKGTEETFVEIVDYCPNCDSTINLSEDAFSQIADVKAGIIKIEYHLLINDTPTTPSPSPSPYGDKMIKDHYVK